MKINIILVLCVFAGFNAMAQIDPQWVTGSEKAASKQNPTKVKTSSPVKAATVVKTVPVLNSSAPNDLQKVVPAKPKTH